MRCNPPRFFYFDLGNVLLTFDRQRAMRQIAEVAGIPPERVGQILYATDLYPRYESGRMTSQECYEFFCEQAGTRPDHAAFQLAACDIFELNVPVVPIVASLKAARLRLGILSNTNEAHWHLISGGRYTFIGKYFERFALSYQIGAMKPDPDIYRAAAQLAQLTPEEIFFVDDHPANVEGARQVGFDAVSFVGAGQLAADLRSRGVQFNY